ncbi:Lrp/AsnC family transcriptional regulator [Ensifer sp. LCM 4579]|uniref:Lrp/AsnC family transcriptional regulator n=1 Tax=Ensifer sp. LCM 4579 TaxID=1848292 RepID=UPI001FCCCAB4|nr:Lrp/AsnC family transcriptional regulator [Ensifer sp. LCM 4579]
MTEIGATVALSPSAVNERIRRLVAAGVIRGFTLEVDHRSLGCLPASARLLRQAPTSSAADRRPSPFVSVDRATAANPAMARATDGGRAKNTGQYGRKRHFSCRNWRAQIAWPPRFKHIWIQDYTYR